MEKKNRSINSQLNYYQLMQGRGEHQHAVIVLHDYFDYHKYYKSLANVLLEQLGYDILIFDFKGFGLSAGKRGDIENFSQLSAELRELILKTLEKRGLKKVTFIGCGMGGLVSLDFLLNEKHHFPNLEISQILINPFVELKIKDDSSMMWKIFKVNHFLSRYNIFEHNENVLEAEKLFADPLAIKNINPEFFTKVAEKAQEVKRNLYFIEEMTLFLIGARGKICDNYVVKLFNKAMATGRSKIIEYQNSGHDLLHDVEQEQVTKDIVKWLSELG